MNWIMIAVAVAAAFVLERVYRVVVVFLWEIRDEREFKRLHALYEEDVEKYRKGEIELPPCEPMRFEKPSLLWWL